MRKLLVICLLFTACTTVKKTKVANVTFTYNPKVWTIVDFTVEDSLRLDSLIKLNNQQINQND
jgi:hypothetical protein